MSKLAALFQQQQDSTTTSDLTYRPSSTSTSTSKTSVVLLAYPIQLYKDAALTHAGIHGFAVINNNAIAYQANNQKTQTFNITPSVNTNILPQSNPNYLAVYDQQNNFFSCGFRSEQEAADAIKQCALVQFKTQNNNVFANLTEVTHEQEDIRATLTGKESIAIHYLVYAANYSNDYINVKDLVPKSQEWISADIKTPSKGHFWDKMLAGLKAGGRKFAVLQPNYNGLPEDILQLAKNGICAVEMIVSEIKSVPEPSLPALEKPIPKTETANEADSNEAPSNDLMSRIAKMSGRAPVLPVNESFTDSFSMRRKQSSTDSADLQRRSSEEKEKPISRNPDAEDKVFTTSTLSATPLGGESVRVLEAKLSSLENLISSSFASVHGKLDSVINQPHLQNRSVSPLVSSESLEITPMQVSLAFEKLMREKSENQKALERSAQAALVLQSQIHELRNQHHDQLDEQAKLIEKQYASLRETVQNQYKQILQLQNEKRELEDELRLRNAENLDWKARCDSLNSQIDPLRTQLSKLSISREASPVVHSESDLRREYERGKIESEQKSSRKVSELTEEVQTLNSTLTRIESEKASLLSKIAELNDQLLKKDPVESEEGKAKALLSCVEYAADMLAQFPDDQSYSAKDVLRIFKISARKVLSKQEADASAPKTHVEDESNGESSKKSE